jgi:hypothetical protein
VYRAPATDWLVFPIRAFIQALPGIFQELLALCAKLLPVAAVHILAINREHFMNSFQFQSPRKNHADSPCISLVGRLVTGK